MIPQQISRLVLPIAVVLAAVILLRSHDSLGDGFVAAGVVAVAMIFRHLAAGSGSLERLADRDAAEIVAAGLLGMIATGLGGLLWSDGFLRAATARVDLPGAGPVSISTSHLFELSIAVVVLGIVVAVIGQLGERDS